MNDIKRHPRRPRAHHDLHHHVGVSSVHANRRQLPRPNGRMINDVFRPIQTANVEPDVVEVVTVTRSVFIEPAPMTKPIEHLSEHEKNAALERAFKVAYKQLRAESGLARLLPGSVVAIFVR